MRTLNDQHIATLESLFGKHGLRLDEHSRQHYGSDWTRLPANPAAVVLPQNTEELAALLRLAGEWRWPLVPSGGRTGLAGGAVAAHGEILVSFERMNRLLEIDANDRLLICEPGVITAHLQQAAREQGLYYPVEFAADGSSQIGGNLATNAGGMRVLRYGMTRQQVAGLQAIDGQGRWLDDMACLRKNNAGYALRELLIGSEGSLALMTRIGLWLQPAPPERRSALIGITDESALPGIARHLLHTFELHACEYLDAAASRHGQQHSGQRELPTTASLLIDAPAEQLTPERLTQALHRLNGIGEVLLTDSHKQQHTFWAVRENITPALAEYQPLKFDLGFRLSKLPAVLNALRSQLPQHSPQAQIVSFGHLGDGNLHVNVLHVAEHEKPTVTACITRLVSEHHGTLTAEHGIGLLRRAAQNSLWTNDQREQLHSIKQAFDPLGLLNPGKLLI